MSRRKRDGGVGQPAPGRLGAAPGAAAPEASATPRQGTIDEALGAALSGTLAAGLLGSTGRLSGQQVLGVVKEWLRDGTVVLAQRDETGGVPILRGAALMLLHDGEVAARHMVGRFAGLAATGLTVHAHGHDHDHDHAHAHAHDHGHGQGATPQLPAYASDARLDVLRALALLVPPQPLVPGATDLKSLLPRLRAARWSGVLLGEHAATVAVAVLVEGRVATARANRSGATIERIDALRVLQRLAFETEGATLALVALEIRTASALAGMILDRPHTGDAEAHTGIRTDEHGYTYVLRGVPYLTVSGGVAGTAAAYAALQEGEVPDLHLPDEPPGWETQRYVLTLRGRDALNPMTELWMRFRTTHGTEGQRLLEVLAEGATIEQVSAALESDLEQLRPWLKRLEDDGLVRVGR